MNGSYQIIEKRSLELGNDSDVIKDEIESGKYPGLSLYGNQLVYKTEHIYPNRSAHPDRIALLFLFTNPHPESVARGLFLSEPHSQTFWQRLFESCHLRLPLGTQIDLKSWDESTTKVLGELVLRGEYESEFLIYFHCLWPVPTKQPSDLKSLFKSNKNLLREIERSGMDELEKLVQDEQIRHIVVFAGPTFHEVTGANIDSYKGWASRLIQAINDFQGNRDAEKYWLRLRSGYAKATFSQNVDVYLALNTHAKNWGKERGKRYFTFGLDMIFERILIMMDVKQRGL